jgi:hypothetical protein
MSDDFLYKQYLQLKEDLMESNQNVGKKKSGGSSKSITSTSLEQSEGNEFENQCRAQLKELSQLGNYPPLDECSELRLNQLDLEWIGNIFIELNIAYDTSIKIEKQIVLQIPKEKCSFTPKNMTLLKEVTVHSENEDLYVELIFFEPTKIKDLGGAIILRQSEQSYYSKILCQTCHFHLSMEAKEGTLYIQTKLINKEFNGVHMVKERIKISDLSQQFKLPNWKCLDEQMKEDEDVVFEKDSILIFTARGSFGKAISDIEMYYGIFSLTSRNCFYLGLINKNINDKYKAVNESYKRSFLIFSDQNY